ncbi:Transcriptional activator spt7, partial [Podochytrium sp. JEL0797]
EALYEHLERTLNDLKGYTEHSEPFLVKVSKRDVPDYYDVIKNPMDLGTMTKKLQNLDYNSKDEFAADLSLIWTNCISFNTVPDSIYRKKAFMMKRKTADLMKRVPDIKIVVKPQEPESESDEDNAKEDEKKSMELQATSGRSTIGSKVRRGSQGNESSKTNAAAAATAAASSSSSSTSSIAGGTPKPPGSVNGRDTPDPPHTNGAVGSKRMAAAGAASGVGSPMVIDFDDDGGGGGGSRGGSLAPSVGRGGGGGSVAGSECGDGVGVGMGGRGIGGSGLAQDDGKVVMEDGPEGDEDYLEGASVHVRKYVK